jgi:hypothetical protein
MPRADDYYTNGKTTSDTAIFPQRERDYLTRNANVPCYLQFILLPRKKKQEPPVGRTGYHCWSLSFRTERLSSVKDIPSLGAGP